MVPLLSVCIPAYERPEMIADSLRNLTAVPAGLQRRMEVVITDDSSDDRVERVVRCQLGSWQGAATYARNARRLGMAGNWNAAVRAAAGTTVLVVHDDDYLLPAGVAELLRCVNDIPAPVMLFGVELVDWQGRRRRVQRPRRETFLPPGQAVRRLLCDSSFVRFPAMVVRRDAYLCEGLFDPQLAEAADLDMWLRLCGRHGLAWRRPLLSAYRIHDQALTTGMWNRQTIDTLARIVGRVPDSLIGPAERDALMGRFYSQFLLAGALRRLRARDAPGALDVLALFEHERVAATHLPFGRELVRRFLTGSCQLGTLVGR